MPDGAPAAHSFGFQWPAQLFDYQIEGIRRLVNVEHALLADEMGLGKTIQTIAAVRILIARNTLSSVLILAPASLVLQWRCQFRQWAPELRLSTAVGAAEERARAWRAPADVYLAGYESLRSDIWGRSDWSPGMREFGLVVADEAQRLKNARSELAVSVRRLRRTRSWALTGTPLENRLDDLLAVLDFAAPGRFDPGQKASGLRRLLSEVQLRRRRRDVLPGLPPKHFTSTVLELGPAQRRAYERARRDGLVRLGALGRDLRVTHVLELILRLKQICNFVPDGGSGSVKLDHLHDRLRNAADLGEKSLVFTQFADDRFGADRLAKELGSLRPLVYSGHIPAQHRARIVTEFEKSPDRPLLILSLKAGGTGLNLTPASHVFHFDRWWNPATEAQAEDRVYRIGQIRDVHVQTYTIADSIEERIVEVLADKRALFDDVIDGVDHTALGRLDLDTLLTAVQG